MEKTIEQTVDEIYATVNSLMAMEYQRFGLLPEKWMYDVSSNYTYFDQTLRKKLPAKYRRLYIINEGNTNSQTIAINKRFLIKYAGNNESDIASGSINLEGALVLAYPLME